MKEPNLTIHPAARKPPIPGAVPFNIRAPWHRNSGDGPAHLRPAPEKPKATSAAAVELRKLRISNPREFARRLTASIAAGYARRGWVQK